MTTNNKNRKQRSVVFRHGHELANPKGALARARFVLYEKLNGISGTCNWCDIALTWKTLCADHLDSNAQNDTPDNLVGSCRACNANRDDGTGYGRLSKKKCGFCGEDFKPNNNKRVFCSNKCSAKGKPKRGITSEHGTRSRYVVGCRCEACKQANTEYSRLTEIRFKQKNGYARRTK